jgi:hypothetical protein
MHHITQPPKSATAVDVLAWLCRATLDVIGEAGTSLLILLSHALISVSGFGYSFHSLPTPGMDPTNAEKTDNELARAFATMFSPRHQFSTWSILAIWFPFLRKLVRRTFESLSVLNSHVLIQRPESCAIQDAKATMQRIGTQLINERKAAHLGDIPKCDTPISRDILSVLGMKFIFAFVSRSTPSYPRYSCFSPRQRGHLTFPCPYPFRNAFSDLYLSRCGSRNNCISTHMDALCSRACPGCADTIACCTPYLRQDKFSCYA